MSTGFQFKQFFVRHDRSSMKVGTDGVLLGAWAPVPTPLSPLRGEAEGCRILDIGTGSGLIALMLAQRYKDAQINAIDIDEASCRQARENFDASPWADHLHVTQCSLQEWRRNESRELRDDSQRYDLIVSNPPFFVNSLKAPDAARCAARHNDTLPFAELIAHSAELLKIEGTLAVIVPSEAEDELQALAKAAGLQCTDRCYVHPKPGREPKRVLLAWTKNRIESAEHTEITERIVLENEHGGRSHDYQQLTKDFYL